MNDLVTTDSHIRSTRTIPCWRSDNWLPDHSTNDWAIFRRGRVKSYSGVAEVLQTLKSWQPMQAILVASPDASRFRPPVSFPELAPILVKNYRRQAIIGASLFVALAAFLLFLFLSTRSFFSGGILAIGLMMLAAFANDAFGSLGQPRGLTERSQFFFWIQTSRPAKGGLVFWLTFAFLIGTVQLVLQNELGGRDRLLDTYGAVYAHVRSGEYWRVLIGPLFHSGLPHFSINVLLLLVVGPITWAVLGPVSALAFFIGNAVGMLAQMFFGDGRFDSFLGISPGVFSLLGLLVASATINRSLWPQGFALLCAWSAAISIFAADLLSNRAATTAHIAGIIAGATAAFICAAGAKLVSSRQHR